QITENIKVLTLDINTMARSEKIKLDNSIANVDSFVSNLKENKDDINAIIKNISKSTAELSQADLKKTIEEFHQTILELKTTIANINSGQGTLGMLSKDKK